jgi:hypothetical protein
MVAAKERKNLEYALGRRARKRVKGSTHSLKGHRYLVYASIVLEYNVDVSTESDND